MSEGVTFSVSVESVDGGVVIRPQGAMDLASWGQWSAAIDVAIATARQSIVVDLASVSFIDSSGLHLIVDARRKIRGLGMTFAVTDRRGMVDRLLAMSNEADAGPEEG